MKQHTWVWNEADCWNSRAPERRNCVLINMELEGVCNLLRALWEKNSHISKEITLAFPAIKTESYLKQLLLLGQFHIYGALLVKSPQSTPQRRFILYWHTWLHNCEKDTFFFYIHWVASFLQKLWNFTLLFHPSFIVGYLWSSAQGVATSCSLCAFQVLSDDKWLP